MCVCVYSPEILDSYFKLLTTGQTHGIRSRTSCELSIYSFRRKGAQTVRIVQSIALYNFDCVHHQQSAVIVWPSVKGKRGRQKSISDERGDSLSLFPLGRFFSFAHFSRWFVFDQKPTQTSICINSACARN